jgi:tRNA threonylcarbamoyl adenosine modification protein YeaZ
VLAIDTATAYVAVAVADAAGVVGSATGRAGRDHAERLHLMVESLLARSGWRAADLDGVAVAVGPGRFTGIRVGVAAAKGFGFALGVPLVGLTSLEIVAAAASPGADKAVAVVDLGRGEVAWRLPSGSLSGGGPPAAGASVVGHGSPQELVEVLRQRYGDSPVLVAGDGALRYADLLSSCSAGVTVAPAEVANAAVGSLAMRGVGQLLAGQGVGAAELVPVYLREADVRISWTTRHDSPRHEVASGAAGQRRGSA